MRIVGYYYRQRDQEGNEQMPKTTNHPRFIESYRGYLLTKNPLKDDEWYCTRATDQAALSARLWDMRKAIHTT